jgi:hypothetical protein
LVQNYRYNFNVVSGILKILNKYPQNKTFLKIRTKDLKNIPQICHKEVALYFTVNYAYR